MTTDVSVIIPSYNRLWSLPKAVDSCRKNKCHINIIVVDDGSSDGTGEWAKSQPDITYVFQQNRGQTYAINKGIELSSSKYIRFLDSDDFLSPEIIDKQLESAIKQDSDLVYSRVDNYFLPEGKIVESEEPGLWDDFLTVQLGDGYGSHFLGMLFRRDLVIQVPRRPDFAFREDRMFLLEFGLLRPKISYVPGCAGYWVHHGNNMQATAAGMRAVVTNWQHLNIFKYILKRLRDQGELTLNRKKAAARPLWHLAHWIAYTHPAEANQLADWVFKLDPDFKYPAGYLGLTYKYLGFSFTEKILKFRRSLLDMFRKSNPVKHDFPI